VTHTPRPWTVERWIKKDETGWRIVGADGKKLLEIMYVKWQGTLANEDIGEDDMALILAAPDMLAALKAAREAISTLDVDALGVATCDYNGAPCQYPIRDELLDNLNKAIAKAEGGAE